MKILITGGSGYLGSRLSFYFKKMGHEVYIGTRQIRKLPFMWDPNKVYKIDWLEKETLDRACSQIDVLIHAAGMNSVDCVDHTEQAILFSRHSTKLLVDSASKSGVRQFIYISTAHVYSRSLNGLINEESKTENDHPYALCNLAGEAASLNVDRQYGMKTSIIRLANAFGPPKAKQINCWHLFINNIAKEAVEKNTITINNPSNTVRNFIAICDVCEALDFVISSYERLNDQHIFNLGDRSKSIGEVAKVIQYLASQQLGIFPELIEKSDKLEAANTLNFQTKSLDKLGFDRPSNFSNELKDLIDFCKVNFREKNAY